MNNNLLFRIHSFLKRAWPWLLLFCEFCFLLVRFCFDFRVEPQRDVTNLIVPYASECTNDSSGVHSNGYTGFFATTRWLELPAGSYQIVINYVMGGTNKEACASVGFVHEIMPAAQYDSAFLPYGRTSTSFSLWMPYAQSQAQLCFYSDESPVTITGAQIIPTHAWAYVHFCSLFVVFLLLDCLLFFRTGRWKLPQFLSQNGFTAVALAGIIAIACLPIFSTYLPAGDDLSIHLTRIEGLKSALLAGQFPARVYPAMLNGKGYAFGLMYADLFLYPAALLRVIGFSLQQVYQFYLLAITAATCLLCWWCLKKMFQDNRLALLASALYTLSAYRLTNVYTRAAVGEYSAMVFLPLVCYGLWRLYSRAPENLARPRLRWLALACGFSGLVQTHLLSLEMCGLLAVLFCLLRFRQTFQRKIFAGLCKAACLTILWNLWFFVPLVTFLAQKACNISTKYDASYLFDSAVSVPQIFSMFGDSSGQSITRTAGSAGEPLLGVGLALGIWGGMILFALSRQENAPKPDAAFALRRAGLLSLGFAGLCLWMASDLFPWYAIFLSGSRLGSLLGKLQFAWRFLSPATFLLVLCGCYGAALLKQKKPEWVRCGALVVLCLTLVCSAGQMYSTLNASTVVTYQSIAAIEGYAPQIGGGEYLPFHFEYSADDAWVQDGPVFSDGLSAVDYVKNDRLCTFHVQQAAPDGATARLPLFYYPGYMAYSGDGTRLPLSQQNGLLVVELPAGFTGSVVVRFANLWFWRLADWLSAISLALTVFFLVRPQLRRARKTR